MKGPLVNAGLVIFNILCTQVYEIMLNPQVPCLLINSFIWLQINSFTLYTMDKDSLKRFKSLHDISQTPIIFD